MEVHGHTVRGVDVGPETRCRHYDSELDVIAIRFPCCETFYPCYVWRGVQPGLSSPLRPLLRERAVRNVRL